MNGLRSNVQTYRVFNFKAFLILLVGTIVTVGGIYLLHGFQVKRSADKMLAQAEKAEAEGRMEDAARSFGNYMAMRPRDREAQARFGRSLSKTAKTAIQRKMAADTLSNSAGVDDKRSDDLIKACEIYNELGLFDEARGGLEVVLRSSPNNAIALFQMAYAEIGRKDYNRANTLLNEAMKADPKLLKTYALLSELLRRQLSQAERANLIMDNMVAANPESAEAYLRRGSYRLLYSLPGADGDIDQAQKLDPKVEGLEMARIDQAIRARKFDDAMKLCESAIKSKPDDPAFPNILSRLQSQSGKPAEAAKTLEAALEKFPTARDLGYQLADNQILAGQVKEAREMIGKLRETKFPEAPLQFLEGSIATREGDWGLAYDTFSKAASGLTGMGEVESRNLLALGICQERINDLAGATDSYRKALAASPDSPVVRQRLAQVLTSQGKLDDAGRVYREMQTTNNALSSFLVQLQLSISKTLQEPENRRIWGEADRIVKEIEKNFPDSIELVLARAELLAARGRLEEAVQLIETSKAKFPQQAALWVSKANLLSLQGKYDSAREELDKAPTNLQTSLLIRLAKIDFWAKRGGPEAGVELDKLAQNVNTFASAEQGPIYESLVRANLKADRADKAKELLQILLKRQPDVLSLRLLELDVAARGTSIQDVTDAIASIKRLEGDRGITWRLAEIRLNLNKVAKGDRALLPEVNRMVAAVDALRKDSPEIIRIKADIEELEFRGDQALDRLQVAIKQGTRQPSIIQRYISLLSDQGRFLEADQALRRLEAQSALDPQTKRLAAELALRSGNKTRAAELVRGAVSPASRDPESLRWRGRMLLQVDPTPKGRIEAKESFIQATAVDPTRADSWLALMEYQVNAGEAKEALASYNRAAPQIPPVDKIFFEALANQLLGRMDLAKGFFEQLLKQRPDDKNVTRAAAAFFQKVEQFRISEKLWRAMIAKGQVGAAEMHDARIALAELLSRTGNPKDSTEAIALINENLKLQPKSLRDRRALIDVLSRQPETRKDAIEELKKLDKDEPLSPTERIRLAQLYADENLWNEARREMTDLLASPRSSSDAIALYVRMLLKHNEPNDLVEAERWINKLVETERTSLIPLELRARWLVASKREKEAIDLIDAIGKANPTMPLVAAEAAERLGLLDAAERYFKAAAAVPGNPTAPLPLALFYGRHLRQKDAFDVIEKLKASAAPEVVGAAAVMSVDKVKSDNEANGRVAALLESLIAGNSETRKTQLPLMLAVISTRMGKYDVAEKIYREILKDKPNDIATMNNLAWMSAIRGKAKDAMPLIDTVIGTAGPSPKFVDTRGMVHLGMGETAAAIDDFRDAIAGRPDDLPAVYFHLALAQHAAKQDAESRESIDIAHRIGLTPEYLETPERKMYEDLLKQLGVKK